MCTYYSPYDGIMRDEIKTRRFTHTDGESDFDIMERYFSGRMTKARWKALSEYCRRNTYSTHCGCEHDCCGCQCSQTMKFSYAHNQVVIRLRVDYNY